MLWFLWFFQGSSWITSSSERVIISHCPSQAKLITSYCWQISHHDGWTFITFTVKHLNYRQRKSERKHPETHMKSPYLTMIRSFSVNTLVLYSTNQSLCSCQLEKKTLAVNSAKTPSFKSVVARIGLTLKLTVQHLWDGSTVRPSNNIRKATKAIRKQLKHHFCWNHLILYTS